MAENEISEASNNSKETTFVDNLQKYHIDPLAYDIEFKKNIKKSDELLLLSTNMIYQPAEAKKYNTAFSNYLTYLESYDTLAEQSIKEKLTNGDEIAARMGLMLGYDILTWEAIKQWEHASIDPRFQNTKGEAARLTNLLRTGFMSVRLGETALEDFNKSKQPSPTATLSYFIEAIGRHRDKPENFDEVLASNASPLHAEYPELTKAAALRAGVFSSVLLDLQSENLTPYLRKSHPNYVAAVRANQFLEKVNQAREAIRNNLLQPKASPQLDILVGQMQQFLSQENNDYRALRVSQLLTYDWQTNINDYRRLRELSQGTIHPEFYALAAAKLKEQLIKTYEDSQEPFPDDDIDDIFQSEDKEESFTYNWQATLQRVQDIRKLSNQRDHLISPALIAEHLHGFVEPQNILVHLDERSKKFSVLLNWQNQETSESYTIQFALDPDSQQFDWTLLDSPTDPELNEELVHLRQACLHLSVASLEQVKTALEEKARTTVKKPGKPQQLGGTAAQKSGHFEDPIYKLRKMTEKEDVPLAPMSSSLEQPSEPNISINTDNLNDILREVPDQAVQHSIQAAVERYNATGHINIKHLHEANAQENDRYRMRVGNYRLILVREGNMFSLQKIGHRREIYSKR